MCIRDSLQRQPLVSHVLKRDDFPPDILLGQLFAGDVYKRQDKKSVAFALSFRAADRTLTDADINHAMERILSACEGEYKAEIRK